MQKFRTSAIPKAKPLKLSQPKPPRMGALKMPAGMKSAPKLPGVTLPKAAGGRSPGIRSTAFSSRIAYAASPSGALAVPGGGYKKQRNQAL